MGTVSRRVRSGGRPLTDDELRQKYLDVRSEMWRVPTSLRRHCARGFVAVMLPSDQPVSLEGSTPGRGLIGAIEGLRQGFTGWNDSRIDTSLVVDGLVVTANYTVTVAHTGTFVCMDGSFGPVKNRRVVLTWTDAVQFSTAEPGLIQQWTMNIDYDNLIRQLRA